MKKQAVFERVKGLVSSTPFLALVNFADYAIPLELIIYTSGFALGRILLIQVDRAICPVAYCSRKLSYSE